ncbi:MAG: M20/M25/M40 family metallo-hydrolase [Deltaproteobacteria bacterium]|nr:M20/M25/M40 family metallo-hydrolase [Deltaproteobacteria bacterium]
MLPRLAGAKFSLRLVPDQDPQRIAQQIDAHVRKTAPDTVRWTLELLHAARPFVAPVDHPYVQAAARAMTKAYGREALFTREGGSIPIVAEFADVLKAPVLLLGFGLASEKTHAPNEHFHLENFYGGIKSIAYFYGGNRGRGLTREMKNPRPLGRRP